MKSQKGKETWSRNHYKREVAKILKSSIKVNFKVMKKFFEKIAVLLFDAKIHATHHAIKGNKSGGNRDNSGKDWYKPS